MSSVKITLKRHPHKKGDPKYMLQDRAGVRRRAICFMVDEEVSRMGGHKSYRCACVAILRRLNVLRIYRKNKSELHVACRKLTRDMRWMQKHFKLGGTVRDIC